MSELLRAFGKNSATIAWVCPESVVDEGVGVWGGGDSRQIPKKK